MCINLCVYTYVCVCACVGTRASVYKAEQVSVAATLQVFILLFDPNHNHAFTFATGKLPSFPAVIQNEYGVSNLYHTTAASPRSLLLRLHEELPTSCDDIQATPNTYRWQGVPVITTQAINLTPRRLKTEKFPVRLAFRSTTQFPHRFLLFSEWRNYQRIS